MIPDLNPRAADNILQYLTYELQRVKGERSEKEADWARWAEIYRARPKTKVKDFPFRGASNLVIPVMATDVDTTVAAVMGVLYGAPNLWSCEGLRPDALNYAARLEEFLEWAQEQELSMYSTTHDWINEAVKLGTGILKQRYLREQKKVFEWRELGPGRTTQQVVRKLVTDRPEVRWVPLNNFYIPANAPDVADAPWCGERLELTWSQIDARVRAGIYREDLMSKLGIHWRDQQPKSQYSGYQDKQAELDNFMPGIGDKFELFEFWLDADLGDGEPTALVCTIHIPSNTYARIDYNPFFFQEKPYSATRFVRIEGQFYGLGLGEMQGMFQEEISTMHNQRIDGNTIRNTVLFKARRGAVKADEPIWPSRIFLLDDPVNDLLPMSMGVGSSDTIGDEQFTLRYSRQRAGISDYEMGGAGNPAISYSAATTTVEMLKQGRMRLDQFLRECHKGLSETGQRVVELYQQFDQGGKPYLVMGDKDGEVVNQILHFPLDTIRLGVAVRTTATNAQYNRETKIRTDQVIYGLVMQFYQQLFMAMQIVVNPQLPPPLRILATQMIHGGTTLARRILDTYGTQDLDQIIPDLSALNDISQQLGGLAPQQAVGPGGAPVGQSPQGSAGLPSGSAGPAGLLGAGAGTPQGGIGY